LWADFLAPPLNFLGSAAVMAVAYGGFALGARVYKEQVLVSEFHRILRLDENILRPMRALRSAPVRRVFLLTTGLLPGFHVILNMILYVGALSQGEWFLQAKVQWVLVGAAALAGLFLLGSLVTVASFYLAAHHATVAGDHRRDGLLATGMQEHSTRPSSEARATRGSPVPRVLRGRVPPAPR
jgi:hypothetical protein